LFIDSTNAFEILYNSRIGVVAHLLNCGLKDKTTYVVKMIKFLMKVKSPYEILEKTSENREMHEKYQIINKKLKKFLGEAQEQAKSSDKLIFFEYGGDTSMSAEISNSLKYLFPGKIIFVVYASESNSFANISGRGENVKDILDRVLQQGNFENARGGGHENAVGAKIMKRDLPKFKELTQEITGEI